MKNRLYFLPFIILSLGLIGAGCNLSQENTNRVKTSAPQTTTNNYVQYSQSAYDQAQKDERPLFLFFYADWCTTCRAQNPGVVKMFEETDSNVQGFRVNYDTEDELKKEFGIFIQHTMILLDGKGVEVERWIGTTPESTMKQAMESLS